MALDKPVVFLSHSSKDKDRLHKLKLMLDQRTSGVIEFFLSSDGQSIPFGRNWVARISEALDHARLMFVFVSEQSVHSGWIFFEAGYAYSKGIRVVPVCMPGIDLGTVPPPFGLLQGFNLRSHEQLNNLLTIFNDEFKTRFVPAFTEQDFESLFSTTYDESLQPQRYDDIISEIVLTVPFDRAQKPWQVLLDICKQKNFPAGQRGETKDYMLRVSIPGATYDFPVPNYHTNKSTFSVTPSALPEILGLLDVFLGQLGATRPFAGKLIFLGNYDCIDKEHRLTAKLRAAGVSIDDKGRHQWNQITFRLKPRHRHFDPETGEVLEPLQLSFVFDGGILMMPVFALVKILLDTRAVYVDAPDSV